MKNKILIVDDEKDTTLVLRDFFVSRGYEALTAFSGREALDLLKQPGIGLILLDIQMPDINGIEILKEARKNYKDAKVIVLTGFSDEYREEVEGIGCDGFLAKPFSVKTLIALAESVLSGKETAEKKIKLPADDSKVLTAAKLLFIEPNQIIYSSKLSYFRDAVRCKGRYQLAAAFTEKEAGEKIDEFKPDFVLSDMSVFRLYRLNEKISRSQNPPKDIILYGLFPGAKAAGKDNHFSFIEALFDPVFAMVNPGEMDKLGKIVRSTAMEHGLYIKA